MQPETTTLNERIASYINRTMWRDTNSCMRGNTSK
uniref:Uncharacterized protein n=1 Tax=Anguilla anguilla TaxID=7936 RepID=A0A0E9UN66_ANGAN